MVGSAKGGILGVQHQCPAAPAALRGSGGASRVGARQRRRQIAMVNIGDRGHGAVNIGKNILALPPDSSRAAPPRRGPGAVRPPSLRHFPQVAPLPARWRATGKSDGAGRQGGATGRGDASSRVRAPPASGEGNLGAAPPGTWAGETQRLAERRGENLDTAALPPWFCYGNERGKHAGQGRARRARRATAVGGGWRRSTSRRHSGVRPLAA